MNLFIERFKEEILLFIILSTISFCTLSYEYSKYKDFTSSNFLRINAKVLSLYKKEEATVLKLRYSSFDFYTKTTNLNLEVDNLVNITVITKDKSFYEFLSSMYLNSLNISVINTKKEYLSSLINKQHKNSDISEIFSALFLAKSMNKELKLKFSSFGISHLIAISGFHLGVLSFVLYWLFYIFYAPIHQKFFPYRNRRFDILLFVVVILFFYLLLTNIVPSLLRAFVMLVLGLYLLRSRIKILSFNTLLITFLFIIALFPRYIFSLGLWFSIFGVFYIFLFLQYFKTYNKVFVFFFFNIWIYLALNPIIHYFFALSSYEQLLSPVLTLLFSLFYPFELLLHLINYGSFLDSFIELFLSYKVNTFDVFTPLWFFIIYLVISIGAVFDKRAFISLNALLVGFNIYIFI